MDMGTGFKIMALLLWPFLLLFLYFLLDRKGFNKWLEKIKQDGFK
ncbi:MAG: hypothetical protein WCP96_09500 [Methylococcaceae bacterium]